MPRPPTLLAPGEVARLQAADLTYPLGGATGSDLPDGWDHLEHHETIGMGEACLGAAARALLTWQVQCRCGIGVATSSPRVHTDAVAVLRIGFGPIGVDAPVRVVSVIDEADRQGFAYGTLPGHPESGEELFLVERRADDTVTCRIRAFFHPATRIARLAPRVTRTVQHWMARRYIDALRS